MNILEDTNMDNMTVEEARWVSNILHSPRCGMLTRLLCDGIADADPDGATFLTGLIPRIVQRMTASHAERIGNMKNFVYMLGKQLSADRVKYGSRKGKPAFLTAKFEGRAGCTNWFTLAFIHDYANFKESARKVELNPDGFRQMTARTVSEQDELSGMYVRRFREILDELGTKPLEEVVSPSIFEYYSDMRELIDWCREHREVWDDMEA